MRVLLIGLSLLLGLVAQVDAAFIANANGTVSDSETGLVWDACTWGRSGANCSSGTAGTYTTFAQGLNVAVAANMASYKGFKDWRLPNRKELQSIVKIDAANPSIDSTFFPNTPLDGVWYMSSTAYYEPTVTSVWVINFYSGHAERSSSAHIGNGSYRVRLVRGGQSFDAQSLPITVTLNPPAGGVASCTPNPVNPGENSVCTATANPGYTFLLWTGDCFGASCTLTNVTAPKSVLAIFAPNTPQEIGVSGNAVPIADGDPTPSLADHTDFGTTTVGTPVNRSYAIGNSGSAALTLGAGAVTLSGAGCGEFSVTTQPAISVVASGSTNFTVQYLPTNLGADTCTVNVNSDDPDENPFDFVIQGAAAGAAAEIEVSGNGVPIADGDTTPTLADWTDFGTTLVGASVVRNFSIQNPGTTVLTLGANAVSLSGAGCVEFTVAVQPPVSVAVGGTMAFQIQYLPTNAGTDTCTVNVTSDDPDENPYDFAISGAAAATAQEITISGNGVPVVDGDTTPALADWTDFGSGLVGVPMVRTFLIHNSGTSGLSLGANAVNLSGAGCAEFTVAMQPLVTVSGGGAVAFQIQYLAANTGTDTCTVNVNSDDADENPYNFAIQGAAAAPALSATSIPTLSPWGLGLLSGALGLAFFFGQRRRRQ